MSLNPPHTKPLPAQSCDSSCSLALEFSPPGSLLPFSPRFQCHLLREAFPGHRVTLRFTLLISCWWVFSFVYYSVVCKLPRVRVLPVMFITYPSYLPRRGLEEVLKKYWMDGRLSEPTVECDTRGLV